MKFIMLKCVVFALASLEADAVMRRCTPLVPGIDLGLAGGFAILSKSGVTTTGITMVSGGHVGVSPIAATAITGFALSLDTSKCFSTSTLVDSSRVYAADYATAPCTTPADMTTAVLNMEAAFTAAYGATGDAVWPEPTHNDALAGRRRGAAGGRCLAAVTPKTTELGAGLIDGMTLVGGVYKWSNVVTFTSTLTFDAQNRDETVWIMQIAGGLTVGTGARVILINGARASNIFWAVATQATINAGAHVEGIILAKTAIVFGSDSSLTGRALAQTAVTMIATSISAANVTVYKPQFSSPV